MAQHKIKERHKHYETFAIFGNFIIVLDHELYSYNVKGVNTHVDNYILIPP